MFKGYIFLFRTSASFLKVNGINSWRLCAHHYHARSVLLDTNRAWSFVAMLGSQNRNCLCFYDFLTVCSQARELLKIIQSDYFNDLTDVEIDGKKLEPPKNLPWFGPSLLFLNHKLSYVETAAGTRTAWRGRSISSEKRFDTTTCWNASSNSSSLRRKVYVACWNMYFNQSLMYSLCEVDI